MSYNKILFFENLIHPWLSLDDMLSSLEMNQRELAKRTGLTEKHITGIIKWNNWITPDVALKFERALWTPASFWNNLQKSYDEDKVRLQEQEILESEVQDVWKFTCYKELVRLWLVDNTKKKKERLLSLLKFFGVISLKLIPDMQEVAFRKYNNCTLSKENFLAWLRVWDIIWDSIEVEEFNKSKTKKLMPILKELTKEETIDIKKIESLLAEAGIRFAFVRWFENNPVAWVCRKYRWKPLIQISDRWKKNDIFWFTLFHELWHVILHLSKDNSIFIDMEDGAIDDMEREADDFAQSHLINEAIYESETSKANISIGHIAQLCGVGKSIVAWRIAHDFKERRWHNVWGLVNPSRSKLSIINTQLIDCN